MSNQQNDNIIESLKEKIDELTAENKALKEEVERNQAIANEWAMRSEQQRENNKSLALQLVALREYADHKWDCSVKHNQGCSCGWSKLRETPVQILVAQMEKKLEDAVKIVKIAEKMVEIVMSSQK